MEKKKTEEIISLNEKTHSEFTIQELELRLETDPLLFMDLFQSEVWAETDIFYACTVAGAHLHCTEGATLVICPTIYN
jgi:hypothetical protein